MLKFLNNKIMVTQSLVPSHHIFYKIREGVYCYNNNKSNNNRIFSGIYHQGGLLSHCSEFKVYRCNIRMYVQNTMEICL